MQRLGVTPDRTLLGMLADDTIDEKLCTLPKNFPLLASSHVEIEGRAAIPSTISPVP